MPKSKTRLVLLGTGNPNPDPDRCGSGILILVDNTPYLIDFGAGVIRRAAALTPAYGGRIANLDLTKIKAAFLTHLHSDHTLGFPDLILTPWIMGRSVPLDLYGPDGTGVLTNNILKAYEDDIRYRVDGSEPTNDEGWRVNVTEFTEGRIFEDDKISVRAFKVKHGTWPNAFGFRFTTADKVIVISGDTAPCDNLRKYGHGADFLVHEVYSLAGFNSKDPAWQEYHTSHHSSTRQLADLANEIQPNLLVLYHVLFWGQSREGLLGEINQTYKGPVVIGDDLTVFD